MTTLTYWKYGPATPDAVCEFTALELLSRDITTSSENVVYAALTLVAEDVLPADAFTIVWHDGDEYKPITHNRFGAIINWPKGFLSIGNRLAERRLRAGLAKRRNHG